MRCRARDGSMDHALDDVINFRNGVCQVRNNLFHGEKFRGSEQSSERDAALVAESEWVLRLVLEKLPQLRDNL